LQEKLLLESQELGLVDEDSKAFIVCIYLELMENILKDEKGSNMAKISSSKWYQQRYRNFQAKKNQNKYINCYLKSCFEISFISLETDMKQSTRATGRSKRIGEMKTQLKGHPSKNNNIFKSDIYGLFIFSGV
jgi:hypothetical protein